MVAPFEAPKDYSSRLTEQHDVKEEAAKRYASFNADFIRQFEQGMTNTQLLQQLEGSSWKNLTVPQVLSIQTLLYRLGFNSRENIDGAYAKKIQQGLYHPEEIKKPEPAGGSKTQRAVLAFQERFGLAKDGRFGPECFAKIKELISALEAKQQSGAKKLPTGAGAAGGPAERGRPEDTRLGQKEGERKPIIPEKNKPGQFILNDFTPNSVRKIEYKRDSDGTSRLHITDSRGTEFVFVAQGDVLYPVEKNRTGNYGSYRLRDDMTPWGKTGAKFDFSMYRSNVDKPEFIWNAQP